MKKDYGSNLRVINLLWTGGWDSTFRLLELSTKEIIIQPYYFMDNRKSEWHELNAIQEITNEVIKLASTKAKINELFKMKTSDIIIDDETSKAYKNIKLIINNLGSQYEWLSAFSHVVNSLELSVEKNSKIHRLMEQHGKMKLMNNDILGEYYVLDETESPSDLISLLKDFVFPIITKSKLDMKSRMDSLGLSYIMNMTWFCHRPFEMKPCGICTPCVQAIDKGMVYRFDQEALKRNKTFKRLNLVKATIIYKSLNKVFRFVRKVIKPNRVQ